MKSIWPVSHPKRDVGETGCSSSYSIYTWLSVTPVTEYYMGNTCFEHEIQSVSEDN